MRSIRLISVAAAAVLAVARPGAAQVGEPLIQIFEPFVWSEETPRPFEAPVGAILSIRGQAYHPNGIRVLRVGGVEVTDRQRDATGAELFSATFSVTAGMTAAEIVIEPQTGAPFRRSLPLIVTGGVAPPPPAPEPIAASEPATLYSPNGALLRGLLVPGLGHFYTDRPGRGIVYLLAAGAAAGVGIALSHPATLECNEFDECDEVESKADLVLPGIVAAAVVSVIGALDARSYAARTRPDDGSGAPGEDAAAIRLHAPSLRVMGATIRLTLLRASFN